MFNSTPVSPAEAGIDALDAGHRVAVGIDDSKIGRIANGLFRFRQCQVGGARQVDRARAFIGVGIGQQAIQRHLPEPRIGAETLAVEEGALLRLHQHMDALHRVECGEIETLGDLQHLQHGEAGRVRWRLGDAEATIADLDRWLLLRLAGIEVARVDQHAGVTHAGDQPRGQRAAIERCGAVDGDLLQRARQVRLDDQRAQRRRADIEAAEEYHPAARIGREERPQPSRAWVIAGAHNWDQANVPCAACIAPSPASNPGVETLNGPRTAMPRARNRSAVAASGAAPVAFQQRATPSDAV